MNALYISKTGERVGSLIGPNINQAVQDAYQPGGVAYDTPEGHFLAGDVEGLYDVFTSITPDTLVYAK